jgi:hypothetical protein
MRLPELIRFIASCNIEFVATVARIMLTVSYSSQNWQCHDAARAAPTEQLSAVQRTADSQVAGVPRKHSSITTFLKSDFSLGQCCQQ